eukprot:TRINITY_DN18457_c0_g1_i1.p1 TRINITY_DN18457_c0_g1~~TRINITY_DN18457_c0_g1_i1.p1  ORF type:complete len:244 (-),score=23.84 TRINITY_DN18457_c0_g1_i1:150-881(-)
MINSLKRYKVQGFQFYGKEHIRSQSSFSDTQVVGSPFTKLPEQTVDEPQPRKKRYARASLSNEKIARRKLEWAAHLVRRMHLDDALMQVELCNKKACRIVKRVLLAARANAVNNHQMNGDWLIVDRIWTGRGNCRKRVHIHGKGYVGIGTIYYAHLWVILREVPRYRGKVQYCKPWWERDQIKQLKLKSMQDERKAQWGKLLGEAMGYFVDSEDVGEGEGIFEDKGLVELVPGQSEDVLTKGL